MVASQKVGELALGEANHWSDDCSSGQTSTQKGGQQLHQTRDHTSLKAMMYGARCWAVRKKEERKWHTSKMRMLRWERGKSRLDYVRNVDI